MAYDGVERRANNVYDVGETALTINELIIQYKTVAKLAKEMNLLVPYMMADIQYKQSRARIYERISSHLTGLFVIGAITKLGAIVISFIAPFIIMKFKSYILGL